MADNLTPDMRRGINVPRLLSRALLLTLCIAATGLCQQLERILPLRTGGRGVGATTWPHSLVLNPSRNVLYCLGMMEGWAVVYDCATDSVIKDLPVPRAYGASYYPATPALWDSRNGKVCFTTDAGLAIVDGATDSITALLPIGPFIPSGFTYDSSQARVVVLDTNGVLLVDAATATIPETLQTTRPPQAVAWDPGTNRYFVLQSLAPGDEGYLTVFDAGSGAVLDSFPLGERCESWPRPGIVCAPGAGKLYFKLDSVVLAVDAGSNHVMRRLALTVEGICYDPVRNRLYCIGDSVWRIDCETDSILGSVSLPGPGRSSLATGNAAYDQLYVLTDRSLCIFDCSGDTLAALLPMPPLLRSYMPPTMIWNAQQACVYVPDESWNRVEVIDAATMSVKGSVNTGTLPSDVIWNPVAGKLYTRDFVIGDENQGDSSFITVFDSEGSRLRRLYTGRTQLADPRMCLDPTGWKLYCPNSYDNTISVIDCRLDTVVRVINTAPQPSFLAVNTTSNKLYCSHQTRPARLSVIDCLADTVITVVTLLSDCGYDVWWHPGVNKVYVDVYFGGIAVVDGVTNQFIREFDAPPNTVMACDKKQNRFYLSVLTWEGMEGVGLLAFDAEADTLVASFGQVDLSGWVTWNERTNKAYFEGMSPPPEREHRIGVVDCATLAYVGSVAAPNISNLPLPVSHPSAASVYFFYEGEPSYFEGSPDPAALCIIDCDRDTIRDYVSLPLPDACAGLAIDAERNRIFCNGTSRVYVFRDAAPGTSERPRLGNVGRLILSPTVVRSHLRVELSLPEPRAATLKILNRLGALVFSVTDARPAVVHTWQWDGRDTAGRVAPAGVYFLQADAGAYFQTAKAVRLR